MTDHAPTAHQRLATFNAHHSHAIFPITRTFVHRFGAAFPPLRSMIALDSKTDRFNFACTVSELCKNAHNLSSLAPMIESIGETLTAGGFTPAHIPIARTAFLQALREHAGINWSSEIERDWVDVTNAFFACMTIAEAQTPPMRMAA